MKTVPDGDAQQNELGKRVDPQPAPAEPERSPWRRIPDHPGWERNEITGDVRRVFM